MEMDRFENSFLHANRTKRASANRVKKYGLAVPIVIIIGLMVIITVQAQSRVPFRFSLVPASDGIAACLRNAAATVTLLPKEDLRGVDTLDLKAEGLPPNTAFTVFLTELATAPFGAAEYIGEFTTNAAGRGSVRMDAIIEEAFSIVGGVAGRKELNHVVLWFADPANDDECFRPGTVPNTPFDGDGQAGTAVLSSRNFLPNAPLQ